MHGGRGLPQWAFLILSTVRIMADRLWLVHPNGSRQRIDTRRFDIDWIIERAEELGGSILVEEVPDPPPELKRPPLRFEPPVSALVPLFKLRLDQIHGTRESFDLEMNTRPTNRVLGGYYSRRCLIRIYTHDRESGRRGLEELFDTFLHEVAHHLEYTEPDSFGGDRCGRVHGRMHSHLFWRILGELKTRWTQKQSQ